MPFVSAVEGNYGFGRYINLATAAPAPPAPSGPAPAYYTQNSGWLMNQPGFSVTTLQLKNISSFGAATATRTYTGLTAAWTTIHDKDIDTNVYYNMAETGTPKTLRRYVLAKGGTTVSVSSMYSYSGATTSVLGACYAPQCMWTNSTTTVGAFIIGGFGQAVVHVLEFGTSKTIINTYTVPYTSEVYGTEVVPKAASGFSRDYGVAYTRASKQMSSWTVDMFNRSWTNRKDNSYTGGTNGPNNGDGMIYYPIGKQITFNDRTTSTNRIGMNDTASANLFTWNITEHVGLSSLTWTYLSTLTMGDTGGYPYHMSSNAYSSIV